MREKIGFKKWLIAGMAAGFIASVMNPVTAQAAQWNQDANGWWYQQDDGSYPANQWMQIGGQWYYFNANGYMATGWVKSGSDWYYMGNDGAICTGWQKIGGSYYYLYGDGRMAVDTYIGDYYVNGNGVWTGGAIAGTWMKEKTDWWSPSKWWYRHEDGSYTINDWEEIGGKWYFFDTAGWMVTNQWVGDYYLGKDGAMVTDDWVDGLYYVDANGKWNPNQTCSDHSYSIQLQDRTSTNVIGHFVPSYEARLIQLINQYREANGLKALDTSEEMTNAANTRSYEITYWFSHYRPNLTRVDSLMPRTWVPKYVGENVAAGYESPEAVFESWKNDTDSNAIMLRSSFRTVGVGVFAERKLVSLGNFGYKYHWVAVFYE